MNPANTICVSQEGPANALALNKDCTQVVIAGRNVFKVFTISENEFSEVCNLRVGKNLNLNFSSIDVAWSTIEENTIATAATNGAVVVWNLGRSGRSKQEHVFSDHKRTVNKVSFHLTEPSLLISGSQDGMMKCFDLRTKEVARTFISNTESIRDVQFSPHQANTFAAVSENGSVQLWDVRRHERCITQFTAHSGPVFACDWHPELPWLATASRDKTIKVWDIHAKPNLEHTIHTIASVGHVKWRPQRKYQVASCALVLDCAVHVWDVRRPHVPLATFAEHRDVTTAIAWLGTPSAFLSASRDCALYRQDFSAAAHPALWGSPHALSVSARGGLARALPVRAPPPRAASSASRLLHSSRKQPIAGSLTASFQAALEQAFPHCAASTLTTLHSAGGATGFGIESVVLACAREYKIVGEPVEIAKHNAKVAYAYNRRVVGHVWEVVALLVQDGGAPPAPRRAAPPPRASPPAPPGDTTNTSSDSPMQEVEEWSELQFHNSGVLGKPTHSIYIPPVKRAKLADEAVCWVAASSAHYVDEDAADWTLPEEAFHPLLKPPHAGPARPACCVGSNVPGGGNVTGGSNGMGGSNGSGGGNGMGGGNGPGGGGGAGSSPAVSCSPPGSSCGDHNNAGNNMDEAPVGLWAGGSVGGGRARLWGALAGALLQHAALGDVQSACCVLLAMQRHREELFPFIEESMQEQWLLGYIELLQRHKMWNVAAQVVQSAWLTSVWIVSQQSVCVALVCGRCLRRARPRTPCVCRCVTDICAVCHQTVRGLYAWCQGCAHGGHLEHLRGWMAQHQLCPAGCGHHCTL